MGKLEDLLKASPSLALLSKAKLAKKLQIEGVSKAEIDAHFNPKEITQVYAKPKAYAPLKITAPPYSFQIDVVFLPKYKSQNRGIERFLLLVDILSRKAFAYPLKSNKMDDIIDKFKAFFTQLIDDNVQPSTVEGDDEFNNPKFKALMDQLRIELWTGVAKEDHMIPGQGDKLGIVDACVKTLKELINKYMLLHGDLRWTGYLQSIVDLYNDSPHAGIDDNTPDEMWPDSDYLHAREQGQNKYNARVNASYDLEPGDTVRCRLGKGVFEKAKQRFSSELFTIAAQEGYRFRLTDELGHPVKRKYRAGELLKVGAVTERLGDGKEKAEKKHKAVKRVQKGTVDKTYEQAAALIAAKDAKLPPRVRKRTTKLDL